VVSGLHIGNVMVSFLEVVGVFVSRNFYCVLLWCAP